MLSAADLSYMHGVAQLTLVTPCTILRKTLTSDGLGGNSASWATLSTPMCCIAPETSRTGEREEQERIEVVSRWIITLPAGQDIRIEDRIVVLGRTYEVSAYAAPRSFEIERTVLCEEVQLQ